MSDARGRLLAILRDRSFERKRVILASGKESDFFIDCKQAVLTAEGHVLVGAAHARRALAKLLGVRSRGRRRARRLPARQRRFADELPSRRSAPRPLRAGQRDERSRLSAASVEGDRALTPGLRVVILEDVITTGGSTLKAAEKLALAGATVVGVVALVDRLEGGAEAIAAASFPLDFALHAARLHPGLALLRQGASSKPSSPVATTSGPRRLNVAVGAGGTGYGGPSFRLGIGSIALCGMNFGRSVSSTVDDEFEWREGVGEGGVRRCSPRG